MCTLIAGGCVWRGISTALPRGCFVSVAHLQIFKRYVSKELNCGAKDRGLVRKKCWPWDEMAGCTNEIQTMKWAFFTYRHAVNAEWGMPKKVGLERWKYIVKNLTKGLVRRAYLQQRKCVDANTRKWSHLIKHLQNKMLHSEKHARLKNLFPMACDWVLFGCWLGIKGVSNKYETECVYALNTTP